MPSERRLRVAVLTHTAVPSGAEIALLRLVHALGRTNPEIAVAAVLFADGPLAQRLRDTGVDVQILELDTAVATLDRNALGGPTMNLFGKAFILLRFVARLARLLRRMDVDVVHCNSLKADLAGGLAAQLAGKRVVWYLHDRISADYLPAAAVRGVRLAARLIPHALIANSQATRVTLPAAVARRCVVAYPGLAADEFATNPPLVADPPTIGIVGRISPTKGQDVFLRAAARLRTHHPDARFLVVGAALFNEGDYEAEVRALATRLGLEEHVQFTGHVDDVASETRTLAALAHASPVPEPFGQVILEAMAARIPVIATAGGGVSEITGSDGQFALVVAPGDVDALASAMRRIATDPADSAQRADRAYVHVRSDFTIEQTAAIVTAAWRAAAERRRQ